MKTLTPDEIESRFQVLADEFLNTDFSDMVETYIGIIFRQEELTDERVLLWIEEAKAEVEAGLY